MLSSGTGLARSFGLERDSRLDFTDWRDLERRRVCLYEVWYRKPVAGFVMTLPSGETVEVDLDNDQHTAAILQGARPRKAIFNRMRLAFYAGPHFLFDIPSPYKHKHFPYIPFFGKREDLTGAPYGLIRAMFSPQDEVNARKSKMLWLLNSRRVVADQDAVTDHEEAQKEVARPDAYIKLNPFRRPESRFDVEVGGEMANQQFQVMQESKIEIQQASGVHAPITGEPQSSQSGIAINSLIEQGITTLGEINDNYRYSRRLVGELLLELVKEDNSAPNIQIPIGEGDEQKIIILNEQRPDGTIGNDVRSVNVTVALDDLPSTPTFRAQLFAGMGEVLKSLPPEIQAALLDMYIENSGMPRAKEAARRVRKVTGAGNDDSPEAQMRAQMQAMSQKAALEQQLADVEKTKAEASKLQAEAVGMQAGGQDVGALVERLRKVQEKAAQDGLALRTQIARLQIQLEDRHYEIDRKAETAIQVAEIQTEGKNDAAMIATTAQLPTGAIEDRIGALEKAIGAVTKSAAAPAKKKDGGGETKKKPPLFEPGKKGPNKVVVKRLPNGDLVGHAESKNGKRKGLRVKKNPDGSVHAEFSDEGALA
jgi:hypothetical protein